MGTVQRVVQVPGRPLVTPEAVVLEFETAGLGSRILATMVDVTIQFVILLAGTLALAGLVAADGPTSVAVSLLFALGFLTLFGYPSAFETLWRGRTPGKAALGLRVMTREGTPVMFRHAAVRAALTLVDFWLTSGAVAVISVLVTRENQRLGDLAAGTVVLRERTGAGRPQPVSFGIPPEWSAYAATLDVRGLSSAEYTTVRSFLVRAPSLPARTRLDLAARFAETVSARVRQTPPPEMDPETFLVCVAALYQQRGTFARPPAPGPAAPEPPAGEPPSGEPPSGEPPSGEPPAGEPPAGEPPAGEPPAGEPPAQGPFTAPQ